MDMDILFCHVQLMKTMVMIRMPGIWKGGDGVNDHEDNDESDDEDEKMKTLVPAPCWFGWVASLVWPPFCPNLLLLCPPTTWQRQRVTCNNVTGFSKHVLVMASGKNCWLLRLNNLLQFLLLVHPGHLLLYSLVKDGFCSCLVVGIICIKKIKDIFNHIFWLEKLNTPGTILVQSTCDQASAERTTWKAKSASTSLFCHLLEIIFKISGSSCQYNHHNLLSWNEGRSLQEETSSPSATTPQLSVWVKEKFHIWKAMSWCYSFITHNWDKNIITFNFNCPLPYLLTLVKENSLQLPEGLPLPLL